MWEEVNQFKNKYKLNYSLRKRLRSLWQSPRANPNNFLEDLKAKSKPVFIAGNMVLDKLPINFSFLPGMLMGSEQFSKRTIYKII